MKNMRLLPLAALGLIVACGEAPTEAMLDAEPALEAAAENHSSSRLYEVTVTNFTGGQPFTPPLVATHNGEIRVFRPGRPASFGVKEIAENGNLAPLETELLNDPRVSDVVIAAGSPPPVLPGGSITFQITGDGNANFVSWISMLICTNDGFTGRDGFRLPWKVGQTRSIRTIAYDAGTELNTQDFDDLVPPCPPLTGFPAGPGTGTSNPALAEGRKIQAHRGIKGFGESDLDPAIHGWSGSVGSISFTRLQ